MKTAQDIELPAQHREMVDRTRAVWCGLPYKVCRTMVRSGITPLTVLCMSDYALLGIRGVGEYSVALIREKFPIRAREALLDLASRGEVTRTG
jgi:hypothetical protein